MHLKKRTFCVGRSWILWWRRHRLKTTKSLVCLNQGADGPLGAPMSTNGQQWEAATVQGTEVPPTAGKGKICPWDPPPCRSMWPCWPLDSSMWPSSYASDPQSCWEKLWGLKSLDCQLVFFFSSSTSSCLPSSSSPPFLFFLIFFFILLKWTHLAQVGLRLTR